MTDDALELAFALDALARPGDRLVRMAYADWLFERGDPRGELLQLRCRLADDPSLAGREQELSRRRGLVWTEHHGLPLTKELFLAPFRRSLAEAVAWHRAAPALRPAELRPPWDGERDYFYHRHAPQRPLIVHHLLVARAARVAGRNAPAGGRLLYFWPDLTLSDSAAMAMSDYFAEDNSPPWEKWVWFADGRLAAGAAPRADPVLVSWVPPERVAEVQLGINVNPEMCINWADEADIELTRVLCETRIQT